MGSQGSKIDANKGAEETQKSAESPPVSETPTSNIEQQVEAKEEKTVEKHEPVSLKVAFEKKCKIEYNIMMLCFMDKRFWEIGKCNEKEQAFLKCVDDCTRSDNLLPDMLEKIGFAGLVKKKPAEVPEHDTEK